MSPRRTRSTPVSNGAEKGHIGQKQNPVPVPSSTLDELSQSRLKQIFQLGLQQGCPRDQLLNFSQAGIVLQPRQLAASAAARLCDLPDGPKAIGYGGARGGGKTHWLLAQMGADDCQRVPGLKCLLLRKVGKSNLENLEDLRQRLFHALPHEFNASRGLLIFPNGSRIVLGHYQCEKDIDSYLGLEYDVIGIEEATQLTLRKYEDILTCCRTSKPGWRPRAYSTTNPGGIGHQWYREKFIGPQELGLESSTRFIPARVDDNAFINPGYREELAARTGWQHAAWFMGRWDFAAGQYFRNFQAEVHVIGEGFPADGFLPLLPPEAAGPTSAISGGNPESRASVATGSVSPGGLRTPASNGGSSRRDPPPFPHGGWSQFAQKLTGLRRFKECDAVDWFLALDFGYTHPTVALLGCSDFSGENLFIVDEHAERQWIVGRHAQAIKDMLARHNIYASEDHLRQSLLARFPNPCPEAGRLWYVLQRRRLRHLFAGADIFGSESGGESVAGQYLKLGLRFQPANMDRISGWSVIAERLGDVAAGIMPSLFIHRRCQRLLECLPRLQHDPDRPGDLLKTNVDEEGSGGDDPADALRYLVATKLRTLEMVKLRGF